MSPQIRVQALSDYLLFFFAGRQPAERYAEDWNWFDDAAMKLGIGTYAIHRGDQAIVYDTFASMAQAKFVRDHLENMGIRKFTVVYSHWHLDHIAGDAVYGDSDAIATSLTRDALAKQRSRHRVRERCGDRRPSRRSGFQALPSTTFCLSASAISSSSFTA